MTVSDNVSPKNSGTSFEADVVGKFPSDRPESGIVMHDISDMCSLVYWGVYLVFVVYFRSIFLVANRIAKQVTARCYVDIKAVSNKEIG